MARKNKIEKTSTKGSLTDWLRENPWVVSTFILAIFASVLLIGLISNQNKTNNSLSDEVISFEDAGKIVLDLVKLQTGEDVELVGVTTLGNYVYSVNVLYQGEEVPVYITRDGKDLVQSVVPLNVFIQQILDFQQREAQNIQIENNTEENPVEENITKTY